MGVGGCCLAILYGRDWGEAYGQHFFAVAWSGEKRGPCSTKPNFLCAGDQTVTHVSLTLSLLKGIVRMVQFSLKSSPEEKVTYPQTFSSTNLSHVKKSMQSSSSSTRPHGTILANEIMLARMAYDFWRGVYALNCGIYVWWWGKMLLPKPCCMVRRNAWTTLRQIKVWIYFLSAGDETRAHVSLNHSIFGCVFSWCTFHVIKVYWFIKIWKIISIVCMLTCLIYFSCDLPSIYKCCLVLTVHRISFYSMIETICHTTCTQASVNLYA